MNNITKVPIYVFVLLVICVNFIPLASASSFLEYYSGSIDDDNSGSSSGNSNGKINPEETIEITVKIENNGNTDVSGVTGQLRLKSMKCIERSNPYVTIIDDDASYGTIGSNERKEGTFVFHVSDVPEDSIYESIPLEIILTDSSGNSWTDSFTKYVDIPAITEIITQTLGGEVMATLAGRYNTAGHANNVEVSGSYAYVAEYSKGIEIVDISNSAAPVLAGRYDAGCQFTSNVEMRDVAVSGNYAYIVDNNCGLVIVDISNPEAPTLAGRYNKGGDEHGVEVSGNYAYVTYEYRGFVIVDVSNPEAPTLAGRYDTAGDPGDVEVSGNYAYVACRYGYVACKFKGLEIVDISNPEAPVLAGSYDTKGNAYDVEVSGSYAYIADDYYGLVIVDISNPEAPVFTGRYDTGGSFDVAVSNNYAYVTNSDYGLFIVDISNPAVPVLVSYNKGGNACDVEVSGIYAYVADGYNGLTIYNINTFSTEVHQDEVTIDKNDDFRDSNDRGDSNSLLFHANDFKDFPSFAVKIKYSQDPLSIYLREHLSVGTLQLLNGYNNQGQPPEEFQTALETELNQILQSGSLCDEQRFKNIELSDEVLKLIEDNPQGQDLIELNRLLLEEAYPQEIEKHRQKEDKKIPGFTFIMLSFALILVVLIRRKSQ